MMESSERRVLGAGIEVLRGELEVVDLGLEELGDCPWEEVDVPRMEGGCTPLITACQKGLTEQPDTTACESSSPPGGAVISHVQGSAPPDPAPPGCLAGRPPLPAAPSGPVDVNTQNRDGLTPLMLAVRDVDLFEELDVRLPWEYRPVEVVRELLALSADLGVCDVNGCSALHYAAQIESPLKDELIHMMVESLRQPAPTPLDLQCFHPDELRVNSPSPSPSLTDELRATNSPSSSPYLTQNVLIQTAASTEDLLESPECVPLSDHHKAINQDKGLSLSFQSAMDTLMDMRQAYQDLGKGSSQCSSLPSLWFRARHLDKLDPTPGLLKTTGSSSCLPVPPRLRWEAVAPSPVAPHPAQLSQSAPGLLEPLLDSLVQARVHIQNRLGCGETEKKSSGRKGSFPALLPGPIRTPKLLAPLEGRHRNGGVLPGLKHPSPLKPISLVPLTSMSSITSRLRRERLARTRVSPRGSPGTRGGSEESSFSSQSSIDLEVEVDDNKRDLRDLRETTAKQHAGETLEGRLQLDLDSSGKFNVGDYSQDNADHRNRESTRHQGAFPRDNKEGVSIKSDPGGRGYKAIIELSHQLNPDLTNFKDVNSTSCFERDCEGEVVAVEWTKVMCSGGLSKETTSTEPTTTCPFASKRNGNKEIQVDDNAKTSVVDDTEYQCLPSTVNVTLPELNPPTEKKIIPIKPAKNKESRGSTSIQTNQSFNVLAHKDHIRGNSKSKSNLRTSPIPSQVKGKVRKPPDLIVNGITSTKTGQKSTDSTSVRTRVTEPIHPSCKKLNNDKKALKIKVPCQKHIQQREPKSARQAKTGSQLGTLRAKSAVDYITYSDIFQEINTGDEEGPVIYEMFAGPVFDNIRVSSSSERTRQVLSAPSRKTQTHRTKHKCPKPLESRRVRRSPVDKAKQRKNRAIRPISRGKSHLTPIASTHDKDHVVVISGLDLQIHIQTKTELVLGKDGEETVSPSTPEVQEGDHMLSLSVIEEVLSMSSHTPNPLISHHWPRDETSPSQTKTKLTSHSDLDDDHHHVLHNRGPMANMSENEKNKANHLDHSSTPSNCPVQPKINTWTSGSCDSRTVSPVFQKFLDDVGEGPLTDDLLRCLAEELISLDERDGVCPENNCDSDQREFRNNSELRCEKSLLGDFTSPGEVLSGSGLVVDDAITWRKGEVLGRGAYGTVYCGLTNQGQLIAVKQVALDASDLETADKEYNRLQEEVDLLKNLHHDNIVGFLGTSLRDHMVSIFMEYVPGGSIASVLHRFGPLPERVLALYTRQILEGVSYLHLNRVIHRDLKGNNVMLMPTGVVKLIDFGCARRLRCLTHTYSHSDLLKSVHGTPYWMAPEVINETGHGRKSDIWSVGCTVFEMATGKPPLSHMDKMAALFYIGARRGLMPSLPDRFSEDARDFVQVCLTNDQKQRPSAEQLLDHPFIPNNVILV
nr:mitogen-activated protein kinase kinase kinase 19 isoform X1 [Oncorhynchus nerka]